MKKDNAKDWQKNPNSIETDRVQVWSASGSMIGIRSREEARELVSLEKAFVISDQAINFYEQEVMDGRY